MLGPPEDGDLNDREAALVRTGADSATALLDISNDILDVSKIEAGQMRLEPGAFQLDALLDGALDLMRVRAADKGLALSATLDTALPGRLIGDARRIRQILLNLLSNAIKFTEAGSVTLSAAPLARDGEPDGTWIRFTITDTGRGIPKDRHDDLFQEFSCLGTGLTRTTGGTGLGLVICRRLASLMGGDVFVG